MTNVKSANAKADVVLIYPKTGQDVGSNVAPPHCLLAIAAPLHKKGYKIRIIDQRRDSHWKNSLARELESRPVCVGISCMTGTQIFFALKAAQFIRSIDNGKTPIIWGGPHPTILPEQTLQNENVDIVAIGEADDTFLEIVEALSSGTSLSQIKGIGFKDAGQITITPSRELMDVETLLPTPWELINVEDYIQPDFYLKKSPRTLDIGQTSRGCPFRCGFCSSSAIRGHRWRAMSAGKSIDKIVGTVKRFKLNGIWIRDDEFYVDRKRTNAICEGMVKNDLKIHWYTSGTRVDIFNKAADEEIALLKKAGAHVLKLGAESGSNRMLELMNKCITWQDTVKANLKAKKHGITPAFGLIIGFPTETFEDMNQTIDLGMRLKRDNPAAQLEAITTFTPLPKTPLYDMALKHGLKPPASLEGWIDWEFVEYDLEGKKIPWFDYSQRKKIGNICYMYTISNAIPNLIGSLRNKFLRFILRAVSAPLVGFYRFRIRHKLYAFAPELQLLRLVRDKVLYKSDLVLR